MRFYIREIAGWGLIVLGLYVFWLCYLQITSQGHYFLQAAPLTFIGFVIFRGGIHLLKVAVAARICLQAQEQLRPERGISLSANRPMVPTTRRV
jgi:hypothetical protein